MKKSMKIDRIRPDPAGGISTPTPGRPQRGAPGNTALRVGR
jgi:hypothetical protein